MYNAINLSDYCKTFLTEIWDISTLQSKSINENPLYSSYSSFGVLQVERVTAKRNNASDVNLKKNRISVFRNLVNVETVKMWFLSYDYL